MPFGTGKRRKSKPEDKPKSFGSFADAVKTAGSFALGAFTGLGRGANKSRKILEITKGKKVDTKYRGVR